MNTKIAFLLEDPSNIKSLQKLMAKYLTKENINDNTNEIFANVLYKENDIFTGSMKRLSTFYAGWLFLKAGKHELSLTKREALYERSLSCFESFISNNGQDKQLSYHAKIRTGYIKEKLNRPWEEVIDTYLNAYSIIPERGEAIKEIINHYIEVSDWSLAYLFTKFSITQYYNNPPQTNKQSFIELNFYLWEILDYHVSICLSLEYYDEAEKYFKTLFALSKNQPHLLPAEAIGKITENAALFSNALI